jgi:transposase InsO family protein
MPWKENSLVSIRKDFITLAIQSHANLADLCRRFNISRKTGYKWLKRYRIEGFQGLQNRSRRPHFSPRRFNDTDIEERILYWRHKKGWGGRKIKVVLENEGFERVPAASTISEILKRNGCIGRFGRKSQKMKRFEADSSNDLWQMDFKGPIKLLDSVCEPLTVLDDYSRFSVGVRACTDKTGATVKRLLTDIFRIYGMPWRILADNGTPWAVYLQQPYDRCTTGIGAWLMTLGINLIHSRPFHPQTCGKEERFHRTLKQELVGKEMNCRYHECQDIFDAWRNEYNTIRPHEALDMATPASRYHVSDRIFPDKIPEPEYSETDVVRSVRDQGRIRFRGHDYGIGRAFIGYRVAIRPTSREDVMAVYFYRQKIAELDIKRQIVRNKSQWHASR